MRPASSLPLTNARPLSGRRGWRLAAALGIAVAGIAFEGTTPAGAVGTGTISGTAFEDANRNGALDPGEAPWSGQQIYLFDSAGEYAAVAWTDAAGRYSFGSLADGGYRVAYAAWSSLKMDWTPSTTGTWLPSRSVELSGQARVDFGWRRIVRSTDLDRPIASYTAPSGLTVQLYNDAVAPEQVAQVLAQSDLIGDEARSVTVRVDGSQHTATASSYFSDNGSHSGYAAVSTVDWLTWLTLGDNALFHEYGHAWSGYFSVMVQQDPLLAGYLEVRGLAGDPRVDSSYGWSRYELVAEDYRQLFGSPSARVGAQANGEVPPAAGVAGLREYLATTFRQPPAAPSPAPTPAPTPTIDDLAVTPRPVAKSGTVTYSLSRPSTVTAVITTAAGHSVRTLVAGGAQAAGAQSLEWDRRDDRGRRVGGGSYSVRVTATGDGASTTASVDFTVR